MQQPKSSRDLPSCSAERYRECLAVQKNNSNFVVYRAGHGSKSRVLHNSDTFMHTNKKSSRRWTNIKYAPYFHSTLNIKLIDYNFIPSRWLSCHTERQSWGVHQTHWAFQHFLCSCALSFASKQSKEIVRDRLSNSSAQEFGAKANGQSTKVSKWYFIYISSSSSTSGEKQ